MLHTVCMYNNLNLTLTNALKIFSPWSDSSSKEFFSSFSVWNGSGNSQSTSDDGVWVPSEHAYSVEYDLNIYFVSNIVWYKWKITVAMSD